MRTLLIETALCDADLYAVMMHGKGIHNVREVPSGADVVIFGNKEKVEQLLSEIQVKVEAVKPEVR